MTETEKTPWEILSRIDVTDKIEKKNGLSYLSWAWAWGKLKEYYPHAWFRKHEGPNGYPYFTDVLGYAFVKVTVGLDMTGDHEVTETFPVLDHRNKAIQGPDAFAVNNALQRCLVKAIAYHGLGHHIYAGEDAPMDADPDEDQKQPKQPKQAAQGHDPFLAGPAQTPKSNGPSFPIAAPDGAITSHTSVDTVMAVFLQFIPSCETIEMLNRFYSSNSTPIAWLATNAPDKHGEVLAAFRARKEELKSKTA